VIPTSEFARQRLEAILRVIGPVHDGYQIAQGLHTEIMATVFAEEMQRGAGLAQRIADGLCAVLGGTCLTHNEPFDVIHSHRHNGGTID
jgi:hypothetical protein